MPDEPQTADPGECSNEYAIEYARKYLAKHMS